MIPNGNGKAGERYEATDETVDLLESSGKVQVWLEESWKWFVAQADLTNARALLAVLGNLSDSREALLESLQQTAEEEEARLLVEGG